MYDLSHGDILMTFNVTPFFNAVLTRT